MSPIDNLLSLTHVYDDGLASFQQEAGPYPYAEPTQSFQTSGSTTPFWQSQTPASQYASDGPNQTAGQSRDPQAEGSLGYHFQCGYCGFSTPSLPAQPFENQDRLQHDTSNRRKQQNEELDQWLFQLKHQDPNLTWANVAELVQSRFGEAYQIPTLRMRYRRYRIRMESKLNHDDIALKRSFLYWERQKWDIISSKLTEARPLLRWSLKDAGEGGCSWS
jgi:hypothetical protein